MCQIFHGNRPRRYRKVWMHCSIRICAFDLMFALSCHRYSAFSCGFQKGEEWPRVFLCMDVYFIRFFKIYFCFGWVALGCSLFVLQWIGFCYGNIYIFFSSISIFILIFSVVYILNLCKVSGLHLRISPSDAVLNQSTLIVIFNDSSRLKNSIVFTGYKSVTIWSILDIFP